MNEFLYSNHINELTFNRSNKFLFLQNEALNHSVKFLSIDFEKNIDINKFTSL